MTDRVAGLAGTISEAMTNVMVRVYRLGRHLGLRREALTADHQPSADLVEI